MRAAATPADGARWTPDACDELARLCRSLGGRASPDEPLDRHLSMGVGGPTPIMVWPRRPEHVEELIVWMARRGLRWRILGGGTNVLAGDDGVVDAVVNLTRLVEGARFGPDRVRLPAGMPTAQALRATCQRGLAGLEWAAGLPGTIGGAAAGNAGCWGGEMAGVVASLDVLTPTGERRTIAGDQLGWRYRGVDLQDRVGAGGAIVGVSLSVTEGDPGELEARYRELQRTKRKRQPMGAANSGCIFRNPDRERSAGRLIDAAGCKGMRVGDAEISEVHGNFLINRGDATADEVEELVAAVRRRVHRRFGVTLEEEIRRW